MRTLIALSVGAALLLAPMAALAQDGSADVTVVPNEQFCNLVADDMAACEQALQTLAAAGMLPQAFAGLVRGTTIRGGDVEGGPVITLEGAGAISGSRPFELDGGDYQVAIEGDGCDIASWFLRRASDDAMVESFEQSGYVYAVDPDRYFVKVIATDECQWKVVITAQR